ncbi:MAG TPA: polysaccharide biosynthesis/export family protein, partial [Verrucomicrobiae bacterium]
RNPNQNQEPRFMTPQINFSTPPQRPSQLARFARPAALTFLLLGLANFTACRTSLPKDFNQVPPSKAELEAAKPDVIVLREGDTVRVSFPGAPNLNTVQQIRRDGRITMPLVGELPAAGLTPVDLEKELLKLYGPQLQTKEVNVAVEASAFPIYVTGAVLRPGRINADRPLTALEAIMEAGIDHNKANLKKVRVIRNESGQTKHHILNLKNVLEGGSDVQFKLRPQDIIFVPEKFSWF